MNMINKISHYAIPKTCAPSGSNCPLHNIDLTAYMPKAWETRYTAVEVGEGVLLREDLTADYTPQGATTDGTYIYRALVKDDDAKTWLQKIDMNTGAVVMSVDAPSYGHANDMCFAKGHLFIAHSSSTSIVYEVDPILFTPIKTHEVPLSIWGIAYDATNDLFLLGGVGSAYLSVYDSDFNFMYRIKPENPFSGMVRQGIHADSNYIYIALDNAYGAVIDNEAGSRIMVYTWNGMFIKSIHVPIAEIEWVIERDGYLYVGTYEGRNENNVKSGKIYKIPFDLYPDQTVITGRPTDVSGGLNNLQRLPEGTPVRLWTGAVKTGRILLKSASHGINVDENGPFRYLRFRFKGANQGVFDWYPENNGVVCIREVDITAAEEDSNLRIREARLTFNKDYQYFTIDSNFADEFKNDASENKIIVTKYTDSSVIDMIEIEQIWGII